MTIARSSYYFLASPYNGSDEEKKARHELSLKLVARFLDHGISLFASTLYNQLLIQSYEGIEFDQRRQLLMPMNVDFLLSARGMILLKVPGWDMSWGLAHYQALCEQHDIPVYELEVTGIDQLITRLLQHFRTRPEKGIRI